MRQAIAEGLWDKVEEQLHILASWELTKLTIYQNMPLKHYIILVIVQLPTLHCIRRTFFKYRVWLHYFSMRPASTPPSTSEFSAPIGLMTRTGTWLIRARFKFFISERNVQDTARKLASTNHTITNSEMNYYTFRYLVINDGNDCFGFQRINIGRW